MGIGAYYYSSMYLLDILQDDVDVEVVAVVCISLPVITTCLLMIACEPFHPLLSSS